MRETVLGRAETKLLAIVFVSSNAKKWIFKALKLNVSISCIIPSIFD